MTAIIIGAGIGGLTAAIALHEVGIEAECPVQELLILPSMKSIESLNFLPHFNQNNA